ncbi:MAG: inositol monophosphatase family protein [Myxococcota bacterium]
MTQATDIREVSLIQPLWNNYGSLSRVHLFGGDCASVIVKHIKLPDEVAHPRGFTGSLSRQRKIRSYAVEAHWYQVQNVGTPDGAPTPRCLDAFDDDGELFILMEDLSTRGFTEVLVSVSMAEIHTVLRWLARFHAHYLGESGEGLWPIGTYWHLDTRPEELANIEGTRLHRFASLLDARLCNGRFQTLVHGDAKLANFCFSVDHAQVAAVDFQYVGRGCAMKDVAYFIGSCLTGAECERREHEVLELYFAELRACLPPSVDVAMLEAEWRTLFPVAWADFERFMLGWSPGHRKLTDYSDATTERAITEIAAELLGAARAACLAAGRYVQANRGRPLEVASKGFASRASDVVTEIDLEAQAIILEALKPTIARFDLGVLAEEGDHDDSRLRKHAFWTIDPLDGTQYFIEGSSGYATSIALVSQSGEPILGVVYDPVRGDLFEVVVGKGVTLNGQPLRGDEADTGTPERLQWFADRSLRNHPRFEEYEARFDVHFMGGAVLNVLQLLTQPRSVYLKAPKAEVGGCAIWDLAAVALMVTECSGSARCFDGRALPLNRADSVFFNDVGLAFASADVDVLRCLAEF